MIRARALTKAQAITAVDKRIWWMIMGIGFFGVIIMKEIALPQPIILAMGGFGLLGLLMVGLQYPEIPLYVLVAYIPFSRLLVGNFGTQATAFNMTNILMGWVFMAHALRQMSRGQPLFQGTPLNRVILLFCLMGAASLMRASWSYGSWYAGAYIIELKRWLTPMGFYFLTLWVVRDRKVLKTVAVVVMIAVAMVSVMAIRDYMYIGDDSFDEARVGGIVEHSNTLGAFFVYYMFLFLGFFLVYPKKKLKIWMLLIPFLMCFRGIMVTFSRGAYLACAFGGIAACFFRSKLLFLGVVMMGVFALANPWMLPSGIRFRLGQTVTNRAAFGEADLTQTLEMSSALRIHIWRGAAQIIKDHPWWGVGYGAFPRFIGQYTQGVIGYMDAHNSYLLIGAEMGVPTLAIFLLLLFMAMWYTYWLYRHASDLSIKAIALGFLAGLCGLLVANMFGSRMDSQEAAGYFWVLSGLIMRGVLIERQRIREERTQRA